MPTFYRYLGDRFNSSRLGTATAVQRIRANMITGRISFDEHVLKENERLDQIAAVRYGDGRLWWIIAAASNIGWPLQAPPGTLLKIPVDLSEISRLI